MRKMSGEKNLKPPPSNCDLVCGCVCVRLQTQGNHATIDVGDFQPDISSKLLKERKNGQLAIRTRLEKNLGDWNSRSCVLQWVWASGAKKMMIASWGQGI